MTEKLSTFPFHTHTQKEKLYSSFSIHHKLNVYSNNGILSGKLKRYVFGKL